MSKFIEIVNRRLREPRADCRYVPDESETLDSLEAEARDSLLNGPEGNDAVRRLITALREIQHWGLRED